MGPGHLFVVRGDLTRLSADAKLVPADDRLNVTAAWTPLLGADRLGAGDGGWLRYGGDLGLTWNRGRPG